MQNAFIAMCFFLAGTVHAATVIYDENISGDAPPIEPTGVLGLDTPISPNISLGNISQFGQNIIIGRSSGSGVDEVDIYEFTIATNWTADLLFYQSGNDNSSSAFRLHSSTAVDLNNQLSGGQFDAPQLDIFAGFNSAGTYRMSVFESGSTSPTDYQLSITAAVPIPAAAWLFASALMGLGWMRRKN